MDVVVSLAVAVALLVDDDEAEAVLEPVAEGVAVGDCVGVCVGVAEAEMQTMPSPSSPSPHDPQVYAPSKLRQGALSWQPPLSTIHSLMSSHPRSL